MADCEIFAMQPDDPILAERVAQTRLHRQETLERVDMLERKLQLPANQLNAEKLAACGALLREQLQNGDPPFCKAYLNLLIDQIEVDDAEVRMRGPKAALAAATSGKHMARPMRDSTFTGNADPPSFASAVLPWTRVEGFLEPAPPITP